MPARFVAPFAGARIETLSSIADGHPGEVAPFAGARIETFTSIGRGTARRSPPSRRRGLKLPYVSAARYDEASRPLRGGAD